MFLRRRLRVVAAATARQSSTATAATATATAASEPVFRCRYAPSPTGFLHLGGLRTALFNYLAARNFERTSGRPGSAAFVLRIEDTDQKRLIPGSVSQILRALRWAGLAPDEAPDIGGPYGPYTQSERLPLYRAHAHRLVEGGHAYPCFCTATRLAALKATHIAYDRHCARVYATPKARLDAMHAATKAKTPFVIRMYIPNHNGSAEAAATAAAAAAAAAANSAATNAATAATASTGATAPASTPVHDVIKGRVEFANAKIDDQILLKSDGFPTYHLASVVDDHLMRITHVIRGEEWLASTPKHIHLYRMFGWTPPVWVHVPLLLTTGRQKLSKRQLDTNIDHYISRGFVPAAVINFVALLGWNPRATANAAAATAAAAPAAADAAPQTTAAAAAAGAAAAAAPVLDSAEFFPSLDPLIDRFALSKLSPAPSIVDEARLISINAQHLRYGIASRPDSILELFVPAIRSAYPDLPATTHADRAFLLRILTVLSERVSTIAEAVTASRVFLVGPDWASEAVRAARLKAWTSSAAAEQIIACIVAELEAGGGGGGDDRITDAAAAALLTRATAATGLDGSKLYWPLRWALTGHYTGAPVTELMVVLGRTRTIHRLRAALSNAPAAAAAKP